MAGMPKRDTFVSIPASLKKTARGFAYFAIVLALYVSTFAPAHLNMPEWRMWLAQGLELLTLPGFIALLHFSTTGRALTRRIGSIRAWRETPEIAWIALAAALFLWLTYQLSGTLFHHLPTEMDSIAQYTGAKIFARGHWTLPSHPLAQFFDCMWFFNNGRFYTFYPPGHMLLLALGHLAHIPALVNPLLGTYSLIATYYLTRELAGTRAAKIALALFVLSPFIVFLSSEYDNRATALLCATLFALYYIRAVKNNSCACALVAGIALGYFAITRPQSAVPYALPFAIHALWLLGEELRRHWKLFLVMTAGTLPFILFFLYYNAQTTGDPFLTGYQLFFGPNVLPGSNFIAAGNLRGLSDEFFRVASHMQFMHLQFFGWPISSLLPAGLLFLCKMQKRYCGLLAAVFFTVYLSLTLSPYVYIIFGPRYLYELSSIVVAFTAIFFSRVPAFTRKITGLRMPCAEWRGILCLALVLLTVSALATTVKDLYLGYGNHYRGGMPEADALIERSVKRPALIFVQPPEVYNYLLHRMPPHEPDGIIIARDLGANNRKLVDYYPFWHVYRLSKGMTISTIR